MLVILVVFPLAFIFGATAEDGGLKMLPMILLALFGLAVFIPMLAVTVRRLHDTGRSGWWYLISFVPYVGGIVLFVFTVLDSTPGPNDWGPNPKEVGDLDISEHLID